MGHNIRHFTDPIEGHEEFSENVVCGSSEVACAYFNDLDKNIVQFITKFDFIVGCMAWLTDESVLKALNSRRFSSVVMQKEDWLRPDENGKHPYQTKRRSLYTAENTANRYDFDFLICLSTQTGWMNVPRYRLFGESVEVKGYERRPLMHHKFLVGGYFCEPGPEVQTVCNKTCAAVFGVWTGSYNPTKRSAKGLENALVLVNPQIARAYFDEWLEIFAHSEGLSDFGPKAQPEWRWGT